MKGIKHLLFGIIFVIAGSPVLDPNPKSLDALSNTALIATFISCGLYCIICAAIKDSK